jgi:GntR family transcriptional regulator/MocR family aminotransferase
MTQSLSRGVFMRNRQEVTGVWVKLFPQFTGSSGTLQGRVREMMVHSILTGLIPPDAAIPPSRALAQALGVSRNTVSLALQTLGVWAAEAELRVNS